MDKRIRIILSARLQVIEELRTEFEITQKSSRDVEWRHRGTRFVADLKFVGKEHDLAGVQPLRAQVEVERQSFWMHVPERRGSPTGSAGALDTPASACVPVRQVCFRVSDEGGLQARYAGGGKWTTVPGTVRAGSASRQRIARVRVKSRFDTHIRRTGKCGTHIRRSLESSNCVCAENTRYTRYVTAKGSDALRLEVFHSGRPGSYTGWVTYLAPWTAIPSAADFATSLSEWEAKAGLEIERFLELDALLFGPYKEARQAALRFGFSIGSSCRRALCEMEMVQLELKWVPATWKCGCYSATTCKSTCVCVVVFWNVGNSCPNPDLARATGCAPMSALGRRRADCAGAREGAVRRVRRGGGEDGGGSVPRDSATRVIVTSRRPGRARQLRERSEGLQPIRQYCRELYPTYILLDTKCNIARLLTNVSVQKINICQLTKVFLEKINKWNKTTERS